MSALGLDGIPPGEFAQRLLDIPVEEFWTKIPPTIPMIPVIDGDIIPAQATLRMFSQGVPEIPGHHWVDSIMMGQAQLDVSQSRSRGCFELKLSYRYRRASWHI